ncbi:MAG TPA: hypothetical protein VHW09_11445 [Bryobacteraceae bacterium]|jgi:hypothetical protein|nr:hypothetical protein [Bryobacteraceae bacterium]
MTRGGVLYHLARADFLQRVRSYGFLVTLGFTAYFCYLCLPPQHAGYVTMRMGGHRGLYDSAYIGTLVSMQVTLILSLAGFYVVKNAVERDLRTGVGQILATTPLTGTLYTVGKAISNFAVLAAMVATIAAAAAAMQLARHEDTAIHVWQLAAPFLFIVLPVMAAVAGIAVLFEVIPPLRGGGGNAVYFFVWIFATALLAGMLELPKSLQGADLVAASLVIPSVLSACDATFAGCGSARDFSLGFTFGPEHFDLTTFQWTGIHWNLGILLTRLPWFALGAGFALLAGALFHRFDPARERRGHAPAPEIDAPEEQKTAASTKAVHATLSRLADSERRFQFAALIRGELRIALHGVNRGWYLLALVLAAGSLAAPVVVARYCLAAAWICPLLIWSGLGTREASEGTHQLVFSTPHPLRRQLPACLLAGLAVAVLTGSGAAVRLLIAGDMGGLAAWCTGALFIPTLALALGVWSGSSKLFEVVYLVLWYIGPANQFAALDFTGASGSSARTTATFLAVTAALGAFALAGRQRPIRQ